MNDIDRMLKIATDTYLFYAGDAQRRGVNENGGCYYLTDDGKKCAVGRQMIDPSYSMGGSVEDLGEERNDENPRCSKSIDPLLKRSARGLPIEFWRDLQRFHDDEDLWYGRDAKGFLIGKAEGFTRHEEVHAAYLVLHKDIARGRYV